MPEMTIFRLFCTWCLVATTPVAVPATGGEVPACRGCTPAEYDSATLLQSKTTVFSDDEEASGEVTNTVLSDYYIKTPQVVFLEDSQAHEAGLDLVVRYMLTVAGFQTTTLHDSFHRLVNSSKPAVSMIKDHCLTAKALDKQPDIVVMWMGLNDLKVQSLEGVNYKQDLATVLAAIKSSCGSPKVVLVRPPLFPHHHVGPRLPRSPEVTTRSLVRSRHAEQKWPNSEIPKMVKNVDGAYALKQSRSLRIVDAQALASRSDFDRTGHFCTDQRECQTTSVLSKAIVETVKRMMNEPVIPGLSLMKQVGPSNTSTWLKLLGASSIPLLGLEGVVHVCRNRPTLYSHDQGPAARVWLPLFDIARLVGVLHIAAFHLFQDGHPWCGFGKYWLSFFFFTSGFASSYSTRSDMPGPLSYVKHGLSKAYLTHAVGIVIFLLAQWGEILTAPWYDVLTTLTLTQSILPPFHSSLNGPAWFLSTLMVFWCLAPHWHKFLGKISQRQRVLLLAFCWMSMLVPTLVCFGVLKLNLAVGGDAPQFMEFHFTQRWQTFLGGMVFEYSLRGKEIGPLTVMASMLLLLGGLGGIAHISPPGFTMGRHYLLFDHGFATFPLFCAFAVIALTFHSNSASAITTWAGLLALPIFILHVPVRALVELLDWGMIQYASMLLFSAIAVVWVEQYRARKCQPHGPTRSEPWEISKESKQDIYTGMAAAAASAGAAAQVK